MLRILRWAPLLRGATLAASGLATSGCLGIADAEEPAKDAGLPDAMGLDGGGFPGFGGDASVGGSAGSPGGAGGSPAGGGGGSGGVPSGGSGGSPPGGALMLPLEDDGFLANPHLCNQAVWDAYSQPSYKAIHVGRDIPCGGTATYRAYMRFKPDMPNGVTPKTAKLRFHYTSTTKPTSSVTAYTVSDYGALGSGDWNATVLKSHGSVMSPSTPLGWIEVDVLDSLLDALASGGKLAFELRYDNEGEDPGVESRWYGITAEEQGGTNVAHVLVTY